MSDTPETQEAVERWRQGKINIFDEMARLERERDGLQDQRDFAVSEIERLKKGRDEAVAARKASAADWLKQVEQANARVSRALQQVALVERERMEAAK